MVSPDKKFSRQQHRGLVTAFKDAFSGFKYTFLNERNFRIHTVVTLLVVTAGFALNISRLEWLAVIICIAIVLTAELVNTAIETTVDLVVGENYHELARIAKDVSAAAVVLTAMIAVVIGSIVFLPYLWQIVNKFI